MRINAALVALLLVAACNGSANAPNERSFVEERERSNAPSCEEFRPFLIKGGEKAIVNRFGRGKYLFGTDLQDHIRYQLSDGRSLVLVHSAGKLVFYYVSDRNAKEEVPQWVPVK